MPSSRIKVFVQGNKIVAEVTFRVPATEDGALTDPTTVTFTSRLQGTAPDSGTLYTSGVNAEVTNPSVGVWRLTYQPAPGRYSLHVQGSGAAHAADEVEFEITKSGALAPA